MIRTLFAFLAFLVVLSSCSDQEPVEKSTRVLSIDPQTISSSQELGRILFYDKNLSINGSVSCSSCHKQQFAFSDNQRFSRGFENVMSTRNSMPIQNLSIRSRIFINDRDINVFGNPAINTGGISITDAEGNLISSNGAGFLFWDGRESELNEMVLQPIINHKEMGIPDMEYLVEKVNSIDYYKEGFQAAFGRLQGGDISQEMIGDALASFIGSITSHNTRFDRGGEMTALELFGQELFFEEYDCNNCHQVQTPNGYQFFGGGFSNIGLDPVYEDDGLALVTGQETDKGKFKIPSLRNVELTAPYMHDGRFETLEEVIEHYSTGITDNENLDDRLTDEDGHSLVLNISDHEIQAIVAFLKTLTDYEMINDPDLSDPFEHTNL